jgi:uncharacterized protein with PIN domain
MREVIESPERGKFRYAKFKMKECPDTCPKCNSEMREEIKKNKDWLEGNHKRKRRTCKNCKHGWIKPIN